MTNNVERLINPLKERHAAVLLPGEIELFKALSEEELMEVARYIHPQNKRTILHRLIPISVSQDALFFAKFETLIAYMKEGSFSPTRVEETEIQRARLTFYFLQNPNRHFTSKLMEIAHKLHLQHLFKNEQGVRDYLATARNESEFEEKGAHVRGWNILIPLDVRYVNKTAMTSATASSATSSVAAGNGYVSSEKKLQEALRATHQHLPTERHISFASNLAALHRDTTQLALEKKEALLAKEEVRIADQKRRLTLEKLEVSERYKVELSSKVQVLEEKVTGLTRELDVARAQVRREQQATHANKAIELNLKRQIEEQGATIAKINGQLFTQEWYMAAKDDEIKALEEELLKNRAELSSEREARVQSDQALLQARESMRQHEETIALHPDVIAGKRQLQEVTQQLKTAQETLEALAQQLAEKEEIASKANDQVKQLEAQLGAVDKEKTALHKHHDEKMHEILKLQQRISHILTENSEKGETSHPHKLANGSSSIPNHGALSGKSHPDKPIHKKSKTLLEHRKKETAVGASSDKSEMETDDVSPTLMLGSRGAYVNKTYSTRAQKRTSLAKAIHAHGMLSHGHKEQSTTSATSSAAQVSSTTASVPPTATEISIDKNIHRLGHKRAAAGDDKHGEKARKLVENGLAKQSRVRTDGETFDDDSVASSDSDDFLNTPSSGKMGVD